MTTENQFKMGIFLLMGMFFWSIFIEFKFSTLILILSGMGGALCSWMLLCIVTGQALVKLAEIVRKGVFE